ncbi:hypothetical protein J2810_001236 [Chryseobacterium rhizosphaerae]|nr:hypothetical protein [Chryseobacterium rhizosphaerae]
MIFFKSAIIYYLKQISLINNYLNIFFIDQYKKVISKAPPTIIIHQ